LRVGEDDSEGDSEIEAGVFETGKKSKKIDEIAEEIEYEHPDMP